MSTWAAEMSGRTAIVTGAASGIGQSVARGFVRNGVRVDGIDRDADRLEALEHELGALFCPNVADLAERDHVAVAVDAAVQRLGRVDVLVNVAGLGFRAALADTTDEQYDAMFAINTRAVFLTCRRVLPHMLDAGGGVIVNVASSLAAKAAPDRAVYAATKAAVVALTRSIAVDYGRRGVRANCVAPGTTDTPWIERIVAGAPNPDELRALMAARQAIGRLGHPEEIAEVVLFLSSDAASFVHGATVAVDGGQTAW